MSAASETSSGGADRFNQSDIHLFFHLVKSVGILGIFCFHYFERFIYVATPYAGTAEIAVLNALFKTAANIKQFAWVLAFTLFSFGDLGVYLFIVASGFGLYHSRLNRRTSWIVFYKKRMIRILPQYYFFLLLTFWYTAYVNNLQFYSSPEGLKVLLKHVFLLQTLSADYQYYALYYFVAVIFQLYLLFPFFSKVMSLDRISVPFFLMSFFFSPLIKKALVSAGVAYSGILITDYFPYFLFGMLIADAVHHHRRLGNLIFDARLSLFSLFLTAVLMVSAVGRIVDVSKVAFPLVFAFFLSLPLFWNLLRKWTPLIKLRADRAIAMFSRSSYVFYLVHMLMIGVILGFSGKEGLLRSYGSWFYTGGIILVSTTLFALLIQKELDRLGLYSGNPGTKPGR